MLPTIEWQDDAVVMVDQRKLPGKEIYVNCKTVSDVAKAIKTMVIRGAPAIGVSAAMGIALGVRKSPASGTQGSSPPSSTGTAICWPARGRPPSTCSGRSSG